MTTEEQGVNAIIGLILAGGLTVVFGMVLMTTLLNQASAQMMTGEISVLKSAIDSLGPEKKSTIEYITLLPKYDIVFAWNSSSLGNYPHREAMESQCAYRCLCAVSTKRKLGQSGTSCTELTTPIEMPFEDLDSGLNGKAWSLRAYTGTYSLDSGVRLELSLDRQGTGSGAYCGVKAGDSEYTIINPNCKFDGVAQNNAWICCDRSQCDNTWCDGNIKICNAVASRRNVMCGLNKCVDNGELASPRYTWDATFGFP